MKTIPSSLFAACCATALNAASPFQFDRNGEDSLSLTEHGRPVYTFQLTPKSLDGKLPRANYLHPVYSPGGTLLTEDFPADHLHHRGIFWAWHQIRVNGVGVADSWVCQDIEWRTSKEVSLSHGLRSDENSARLEVLREWAVGSDARHIVREHVLITAHRLDARFGRRLDFTLRLLALVDGVTLGGSDDVKGYGGFSPRIRLAEDVRFHSRDGEVEPEKTAVAAGPWLDMTETLEDRFTGMTMMVHPSHPDFPLKWILRSKRSMQNPQWPGRTPVPLSRERDTVLRYRLLLHDLPLSTKELETEWRRYSEAAD